MHEQTDQEKEPATFIKGKTVEKQLNFILGKRVRGMDSTVEWLDTRLNNDRRG